MRIMQEKKDVSHPRRDCSKEKDVAHPRKKEGMRRSRLRCQTSIVGLQ